MKKILVIGSANADLCIHADRMPQLGETISGHNFSVNCGGKGANQAVAAAKLGGNVSFLGAVGADGNGDMLINNLKQNNVDFSGIRTTDTPTGTASITVVGGDNFIILNAGANDELTPEIIEKKADIIKNYDYIIMQLEIPTESVLCAAKIAKNAGKTVILNPAPYKELPDEIYKYIDIIVPNEYEAQLMTGITADNENCPEIIDKLKSKGIKNVIITLGERGCVYNNGDEIIFHPAKKTTVKDTTSAGDCFIGAVCTKLSKGEDLNNAIKFATKASAITVSRNGASESIPFANEIE